MERHLREAPSGDSFGDGSPGELALLEAVIGSTLALVFSMDPADLTILYVSSNVRALLGYEVHEVVGVPGWWVGHLHPSETNALLQSFADDLGRSVVGGNHEFRFRHKDGSYRWFQASVAFRREEGERSHLVVGYAIDITERKGSEQALRESEQQYRLVVETSPDGIAVHQRGTIMFMNSAGAGMLGAESPEELIGRPVMDFVHPSFRSAVAERFRGLLEDGAGAPLLQERFVCLDGSEIDVEVAASPLALAGEPAVLVVFRDITERTVIERALREAEAKYRTLVEQLPAIVYLGEYGEQGDWLYISPQIESVLGYSPEEWLAHPHPMASFTHPEDLVEFRAAEESSHQTGHALSAEVRMRTKGGRWVWILHEATAVRDESGVPLFLQGMMYDVTERKQAEQELWRANRALRVIGECNQALIRARDEPSLLADVCQTIVDVGGYRLAWVGYAENDAAKTVRPVAQTGFEDGYLDHLEITWADEARGQGPTGTAIRTGQAAVARSIPEDPRFAPWREEATRRGYASSIALPLRADGECFGALNVYAEETDAFDEQEIGLLSELADDLAFGILAMRVHTELRETVDILRKTDQQRRELLSRVVTAQDEERRSIASDIHDDTTQALTVVGLRLGVLRHRLVDPEQLDALSTLQGSVDDAVRRLRSLAFELRPPALDRDGLVPALHEYLKHVGAEAGFDYQIENRLAAEPPTEVRAVIYRIVQEALANVRKHAQARNVEIVFQPRGRGVLAHIRDDGVGFDAEESKQNGIENVGLSNMRERAEMAGGWCRVSGAIGAGTLVELWVPSKEGVLAASA